MLYGPYLTVNAPVTFTVSNARPRWTSNCHHHEGCDKHTTAVSGSGKTLAMLIPLAILVSGKPSQRQRYQCPCVPYRRNPVLNQTASSPEIQHGHRSVEARFCQAGCCVRRGV